jgi:hypothetical protein
VIGLINNVSAPWPLEIVHDRWRSFMTAGDKPPTFHVKAVVGEPTFTVT